MGRTNEDWGKVLAQIEGGDRLALLKLSRMVTGFLSHMRAYDFRDEWDDVVQNVVIEVIRARREGRLRDVEALAGWVKTVTTRQFIAMIKRIRPDSDAATLEKLAWSPETDLIGLELGQLVERLPEKQRRVIVAIYIEQRTVEEASRSTGIPLGSVKRYQRQALETLRSRIAAGASKSDPLLGPNPTDPETSVASG